MTPEELQAFINKYNGVGVDLDGYYGDQCMDLMHLFIADGLGLPTELFAADSAWDAWLNANDSRFDKVVNDPKNPNQVPPPGAILFFKPNVPGITGPAGHVSINYKAPQGVNKLTSFDQNYPTGSVSHLQDHTYDALAGWLVYKGGGNVANMYRGYDLSNPDSMKVAVDILVRVQQGDFVDKSKYDADIAELKKQLQDAQNKPTGDPALQKKVDDFKSAFKALVS